MRPPRLVVGAGVVVAASAGWWLLGHGQADNPGWAEVKREDLVLGLPVTGTLEAVDSSQLGPPQVPNVWEYKISMLAAEGAKVERGTPVLAFDASALTQRLDAQLAEVASATKKIEQKEVETSLKQRQDDLELAEAEAKAGKAKLIVDRPGELSAAKELEKARLDLEEAEQQIAFVSTRMESSRRANEVLLASLRDQRQAAERRVREIRDSIEQMTVKAPRDGTVVLVSNWRSEKKKVGDSAWRGEKILEIPDLRAIRAKGEVDEADAGRLAVGLPVKLRLDAHPDVEYAGKVVSLWGTVEQRSWRDPVKVVRIDVDLEATDTIRMRPGMRFRGTIEAQRIPSVVVAPIEAVFPTADGPVAYRKTRLGYEAVRLDLGKRSDTLVEVLRGLSPGDRIARRDLASRESAG